MQYPALCQQWLNEHCFLRLVFFRQLLKFLLLKYFLFFFFFFFFFFFVGRKHLFMTDHLCYYKLFDLENKVQEEKASTH